MKQLLTLLLLVCSLAADAGKTAIPDMKFRRLDTRDGLSNAQLNCLFQDSKGYVWIGTSYGLNRYDGYRFRTFYSNAHDTLTLRSNYVDMIWEDFDGKLWLKQGMNYSLFDPVTEKTVRNPSPMLAELGITGGIDRIYVDSKKNLWVKTYANGLYCYNPKTKKSTLVKYGYGPEEFPNEFWFSSFAEYKDLLIVSSSDGDLMAVDGTKGKVVWKDPYMRQNGGQEKSSYDLYVDNSGNFWVLTPISCYIYCQKEKKWYNSINSFLGAQGVQGLPDNMLAWVVMEDHRNWLWLGTDHEGLWVIDTKTKEARCFMNNKFDETSISENTLKHMLLDKDGNMWVGAYRNGLNQYIEKQAGITNIELGDINTTVEDHQGNYWLGTDNRGIIKYNPKTEETQIIDKSAGFASNTMVSSYCSRDGSLWFGTYNGGLIQIAPNGHITNILATGAENGLLNNNVWSVTEDKWGDIWLGTLGNGVQRMNRKTGKFKTWSTYNTNLRENFMTSVGWIKKGWLLVGHSVYYSLINPVSGRVMNIEIPELPGKAAAAPASVCVVEDSRGLIWQGSMSGCCVLDQKNGWQQLLDMNSGLFGSSVTGIVEDLNHTMWVVTEHGVSNVTPQKDDEGGWTFLVRSFSSKDGLQQGPYNLRSVSLTHDGKILIGGLGGLDIIDPKLVSNSSSKEQPIFSGLKLFGQLVEVGREYEGHVILDEALDACRELTLRPDENQFTIQLATDKGQAHNPARFIYQLEGFSDKWIKTEENDPNITYMSLHHGSYVLHVRMLNDDGSMGENEATLKITITPPLLRNRWLLLAFLLVVGIGVWFWRKRFMERQQERMQLEQLRRETEKKQWMSEMRKQMEAEGLHADADASKQAAQEGPRSGVKEPVDVVALLKDICDHFEAPEHKNIRLSFFPVADHLEMVADKESLRRMMLILLNNAANFSPKNSKVKVFAEQGQGKAVIRVADNGIGIPTDVMPHLFEQIVSDDDATNLHEVFDIVYAHGGTIQAQENKGGGTVFVIEFPLEGEEGVEEAVLMDDENG
jgi:ligand-binding sensor domain-containing protein